MSLGPQFALPGMEYMPRAEPHQQTERQFQNRPDVFFHGRMEHTAVPRYTMEGGSHRSWDFHAGTEQAARERTEQLGTPWARHEPRFYAGRVDRGMMRNDPESPIEDQGEDWDQYDHSDQYYRNEHEDEGSISVVLGRYGVSTQQNFVPWRTSVHNALESGKSVPHHVKAMYEESGGPEGPITHQDPGYKPDRMSFSEKRFSMIPLGGDYDFWSKAGLRWGPKRFKGLSEETTRVITRAKTTDAAPIGPYQQGILDRLTKPQGG